MQSRDLLFHYLLLFNYSVFLGLSLEVFLHSAKLHHAECGLMFWLCNINTYVPKMTVLLFFQ